MSWFKIDDGFHCHPKVLEAGNEAIGLYVRCGSYSSQQLTEGFVPRVIALMYGDTHLIDALVKVGLFKAVDGGWQIHDYGVYNPTREQVLAEREASKTRQRNARERARQAREEAKRKAAEADGGPDRNAVSHAVTPAVTHGVSHISQGVHDAECHAVTHASPDAHAENGNETVTEAPIGSIEKPAGHSDSADVSRRDCTRESRSPRPDPTRPVLPTEVLSAYAVPSQRTAQLSIVPDLAADKPPKRTNDTAKPETEGQRVNRLARTYTDRVKLSNFNAVAGVVRKAVRATGDDNQPLYTDQQIEAGLAELVETGWSVSANTLRTAIEGPPVPALRAVSGGSGPYRNPTDPNAYEGLLQ